LCCQVSGDGRRTVSSLSVTPGEEDAGRTLHCLARNTRDNTSLEAQVTLQVICKYTTSEYMRVFHIDEYSTKSIYTRTCRVPQCLFPYPNCTVILFSSRYLFPAKSICPTCEQAIHIFMQIRAAAPPNRKLRHIFV
jgi:hypothetical protein